MADTHRPRGVRRSQRPAGLGSARLGAVVAFIIAVALCAGSSAQTRPGAARNFLWKVQSGAGVLYLAGSVHALSPDAYPLNAAYQRAFDASGALVEEIDLTEADVMNAAALLAKGMYQDGRTFDRVVSKETAALVAAHLKDTPLGVELIQTMKPWLIAVLLSGIEAEQAGLDPNLGLDKYFFDKAKAAGKPIIGLETAASQIDRFDTMPETLQEQMLRSTLAELQTANGELKAIVGAWQRGDAASLEKTFIGSFDGYPGAYASLIVERNHNWLPQLDACLTRRDPCFVIVGAAHLVGPDGLLKLLQAKGYRVEQQ